MRAHYYTTEYRDETLEKVVRSLVDHSFTRLHTRRMNYAVMKDGEMRLRGFFMRARGSFTINSSGSDARIHYRFSRTLLIYPAGLLFLLGGALFGDFKDVGPIGIGWARILEAGIVLFTGLLLRGMAIAHRHSFIKKVEAGLKLRPVKGHRQTP